MDVDTRHISQAAFIFDAYPSLEYFELWFSNCGLSFRRGLPAVRHLLCDYMEDEWLRYLNDDYQPQEC